MPCEPENNLLTAVEEARAIVEKLLELVKEDELSTALIAAGALVIQAKLIEQAIDIWISETV